MAKDISTVGAKVVFSGGLNVTISEFSDEGTPFDAPDVDASTNAKNLNGEMISSRTPSVYPFSVTVIPGTLADQKLTEFLRKSLIQPSNAKSSVGDLYCNCVITMPAIFESSSGSGTVSGTRTYAYSRCRIKSGPTGPSSSADGRQAARTFTFEAESVSSTLPL